MIKIELELPEASETLAFELGTVDIMLREPGAGLQGSTVIMSTECPAGDLENPEAHYVSLKYDGPPTDSPLLFSPEDLRSIADVGGQLIKIQVEEAKRYEEIENRT